MRLRGEDDVPSGSADLMSSGGSAFTTGGDGGGGSGSERVPGRKQVLLLGGWSPGPLDAIKWRYRDSCDFHEPPMHMPPSGCNWCFTWEWAGLCVSVGLSAWILAAATPWRVVLGLTLLLASMPLWIVLLVRGSIRRSVSAARDVIAGTAAASSSSSERVGEGGGIDLVVGFSWGGGVGCWLLESGAWAGPTILLAPTVCAMASASRRALPRFDASRRRGGENGDETTVDVFHPTVDPFCPSRQVPYLRERGAEVHVVRDSHVLVGMHTWEQIKRSFEKLLEIPIDASA